MSNPIQATCHVYLMEIQFVVIKNFRHKGLQQFFESGSKAGIQAIHATRLRIMLTRLDSAINTEDMNAPGWKLHPLKGELSGHWAIWVDKNWRLTFRFMEKMLKLWIIRITTRRTI